MKKFWILLILTVMIAACSGSKKDKSPAKDEVTSEQNADLVTYKYKIDGLQDTIIADSIWRIIFQVEGIDKLVISRDDSMAVFTVDPELVNNELLRNEITRRGGVLLIN